MNIKIKKVYLNFQIIIVGDVESEDTQALLRCVHSHFLPNKVLLHWHPDFAKTSDVSAKSSDVTPESPTDSQPSASSNDRNTQSNEQRISDLRNRELSDQNWICKNVEILGTLCMIDGKATAYVCENFVCSLPINTVEDLEKVLHK